jgi:multidrug/hemolysin transport system ATP-binding protein
VLDKSLTVYDNLKYRAGFYGITGDNFEKKYKELEKLFDLFDIKNKQLSKLSGGQKRKVDIARSIIHNPKILILDEPTTGLDPGTRRKIWNIIRKLRKDYKITVFLTTHYMEEASDADYITILDKGSIVAEGTSLELKNKYASDTIIIYNALEDDVKKLKLPYKKIRDAFKLEIKNTQMATDLIVKNKEVFKDYEIIKGNMDDVFLSATGYELEGE